MVFYSLTYIANSLCMVSKDTNINDLREKDSGYIKCLLFGLANYINLLKFNRFMYVFEICKCYIRSNPRISIFLQSYSHQSFFGQAFTPIIKKRHSLD